MADQGYAKPSLEQQAVMNKALSFKVKLAGNTTVASITAGTSANAGAQVWIETASASAPTDANFSGLTLSVAPVVLGIYVNVGDAIRLHGATVPVNSIRSASMTAGVVTNKGATSAIAGNTGVTTSGNLAFQVSCTSLDGDASTANHEFTVDLVYDAKVSG